jgi:hypothetical protein
MKRGKRGSSRNRKQLRRPLRNSLMSKRLSVWNRLEGNKRKKLGKLRKRQKLKN